ncbi:Cyclin-L2 [Echinococcus granulosus]|uniref:Cyclin-L2 n=1 Tax=Echinococcus granulosus TaxID=6210 RepID=W6UMJ5_ECHGR|nr:Cyclin-L2 [Echinococcus granulosus]EUB62765.1 Cyclin-L2 [Echinococcus granulosus]
MASSEWVYAGVHLSIDNYVIPPEKLFPTPSNLDGLDAETEFDLRYIGCELIQDAGTLLRLPQVAMATAQVLYQRYFYSKSFVRYVYEHYAMACIFLAAKIEECPRRIREVINVFHHMKQAREARQFTPVLFDQAYVNLKRHIIKAERRVLKELGFCVHGKHPHKLIIMYLRSLSFENNKELVQTSWNCMNDVLRTDVFVRHTPEAVACACIFLAARRLGIPLPRHPPWWEMFNVDDESVHEIALCLQRLYAREKPSISALESRLAESERAVPNGIKSKSSPTASASETIQPEVSAPPESVKHPSDKANGVTVTDTKDPKVLKKRSRSPYNDGKYRRRHRSRSPSSYSSTSSRSDRSPPKHTSRGRISPHRSSRNDLDRKTSRSSSRYVDEARSLSQVVQLPQEFLPARSPAHGGFGYMIFKGLLEVFIHDAPFTIIRVTDWGRRLKGVYLCVLQVSIALYSDSDLEYITGWGVLPSFAHRKADIYSLVAQIAELKTPVFVWMSFSQIESIFLA